VLMSVCVLVGVVGALVCCGVRLKSMAGVCVCVCVCVCMRAVGCVMLVRVRVVCVCVGVTQVVCVRV
jgi:hypothetical protein